MGSGKTTFTRMLGKALGIKGNITSPTFVGLHEYRGDNFDFLHFDIYQVGLNYYDLKELLLQNPQRKKILVVEWAQKLAPELLDKLAAEGLKLHKLDFTEQHLLSFNLA
jgi:tRNA threonylcarbamoyladenosine biosynthesis protein TsaE